MQVITPRINSLPDTLAAPGSAGNGWCLADQLLHSGAVRRVFQDHNILPSCSGAAHQSLVAPGSGKLPRLGAQHTDLDLVMVPLCLERDPASLGHGPHHDRPEISFYHYYTEKTDDRGNHEF